MPDPGIEMRALLLFERLAEEPHARGTLLREAPGEVREAVLTLEAAAPRSRASFPTVDDAAPVRTLLALPTRIGAYRLGDLLGEGGMALVFAAARDDGLFEHHAAVKLIHPDYFTPRALERFAEERRMLARIEHPGVARLIDGGVTGGWPYILMEKVDGLPIDGHAAGSALVATARVGLMLQVCAAVAGAHAAGVVHGDLKPSNVLVDSDGRVRLLDFGVARLVGDGAAPGRLPLTEAFASPERRAGALPSHPDDIFALGMLLRATFGATALPPDLAAIADKASAHDPDARYASVPGLVADLDRWTRGLPVEARGRTLHYVAARLVQRQRRLVLPALLVAVLLAIFATVAWQGWQAARARQEEAAARVADVRHLSRFMLFDLYDRLARQPGTAARREEIADEAARYLDRLGSLAGAPADLRLEAARAFRRLAAVQGLPGAPNVGRPDQAQASLARAERLLAASDGAPPRDPAALAELGWIAADRWTLHGDGDASAAANARARRAFDAALALQPDLAAARLGRIATIGNDAYDLIWSADRPMVALGRLRRALIELRGTAWPAELSPAARLIEIRTLNRMGDATYYAGDIPGSLVPFRRADALVDAAIAGEGATPQLVILKGEDAFNISGSLGDMPGQSAEALKVANAGAAVLKTLLAAGPDAAAEKKLLVLYGEQAMLLEKAGRGAAATATSRASVALREARLRRSPDDPQRMRDLAIGLGANAELMGRLHASAEACTAAGRAASVWSSIRARGRLGALDARRNVPHVAAMRAAFCRGSSEV